MLLTKSYIDELTRDYSIEAIRFSSKLEEKNIPLRITEDDLLYLVTRLCDLRNELDNLYDEREGMNALYEEAFNA